MTHKLKLEISFGDIKDLSLYFQTIKEQVKYYLTKEEKEVTLEHESLYGSFNGTLKIDKNDSK